MAESIDYNGYRIEVSPLGKGWRTMIYPLGSKLALPENPSNMERVPKETIIAEAMTIIDARV